MHKPLHPFVDGHLICFYILTFVINSALNMCMQYLFEILISVSLDLNPEVLFIPPGNMV